jgi:hypothetical protein
MGRQGMTRSSRLGSEKREDRHKVRKKIVEEGDWSLVLISQLGKEREGAVALAIARAPAFAAPEHPQPELESFFVFRPRSA